MGSVIDYIDCPRCGQPDCVDDFYYKTGEEYIFCQKCGYQRIFRYKRDEEGKYLRQDAAKGFTFDNLIGEEIHIEEPYGAFRVESTQGGAECGTLETEEQYQEFVSHIVSFINQPNTIQEATVSRFVDGEIKEEVVYKKESEPEPVNT
jgi:hypothetical protein